MSPEALLGEIKKDPRVHELIQSADRYLAAVGYTEHGLRHAGITSGGAKRILEELGREEPLPSLAGVAGYLHDIGNVINRETHGPSGALLAMEILEGMGADPRHIALVMSAIGNHEETNGEPLNEVAAALILADKSDVHRSRVRNPQMVRFDIHDRVNYAVEKSDLRVEKNPKKIVLELTVDNQISQIMEYFETFLSRLIMCRRSAQFLGCDFDLYINKTKLL